MTPSESLRALSRSIVLAGIILAGFFYYLWLTAAKPEPQLKKKLHWMQWMSRRFLGLLNCRVETKGSIPRTGLIVSNHLSYLDILVIGSVCPAVFVAKSEVRGWPVFGWLATMAGTVFIERKNIRTIRDQLSEITRPLALGIPVVLFPEGTSSDGSQVLPFRSPLLEASKLTGSPLIPAAICYQLKDHGRVSEIVCYWGDMNFASHLFTILSKKSLSATLSFASKQEPFANRKQQAEVLRLLVADLRQKT